MITTAAVLSAWSQLGSKCFVTKKIALDERSLRALVVFLALTLFVLGFVYIYALNSLAAIGYEVKDLEERKSVLSAQTEKLSVQVAEAESSVVIMEKITNLEMVPAYKVSYISADQNVALK